MGGQTHPTFRPTLVICMLDEMLDAFDRGFNDLTKIHGGHDKLHSIRDKSIISSGICDPYFAKHKTGKHAEEC